MIDPITAISIATNAFGTIQRMVKAGKGVEDTLSQLGRWYGAVADLNEHKRRAENPPLFKRIIASKSVEQEAMEIYAHEKKIKQQEAELRELLMYTYGPEGYKELVALRRKIKDQREKTVYLQARKRKAFFWNSIQIAGIAVLGYAVYFLFALILGATDGNG
jgi:GrpB-like predicted nucleotidyltransferase (UPF0157 family)